jgi:acetyl-CoA carboxylase biotin carboxyl carrier protein
MAKPIIKNTAKTGSRKNQFDDALVRRLSKLLNETGLTEIEYGESGWHLRVAKQAAPPFPTVPFSAVPAPETAAVESESAAAADADHPGVIVSPMVGVCYTKPEPDQAPFFKVGDEVEEGDTVLLIEAMKVFNPIKTPRTGKISRILVSNGTPVEFGEPLLIIE